ncbi:MAG: murein L,D-transpeptidase [Alphaproteobacteria bacterium]|nr:murein L,D-transpeptidase [Alphaproteobacteria bacterium]
MIRVMFLLVLLTLSACDTIIPPTSALLEYIRGTRQTLLAREVKTQKLQLGAPVFLRVFKQENVLEAWIQDKKTGRYTLYKTYPICRFSGNLGPKLAEGDKQAPEGFYLVGPEQMNPQSQFHLAFNLGYPNAYDRAQGRTGSALMIHGGCQSTGCFAMTDPAIEDVYLLLDNALRQGQTYVNVHIFPFRMTEENMQLFTDSQWYGFWQNLKAGYDAFEATHIPPLVGVEEARYVFHDRRAISALAAAQTQDKEMLPPSASQIIINPAPIKTAQDTTTTPPPEGTKDNTYTSGAVPEGYADGFALLRGISNPPPLDPAPRSP